MARETTTEAEVFSNEIVAYKVSHVNKKMPDTYLLG